MLALSSVDTSVVSQIVCLLRSPPTDVTGGVPFRVFNPRQGQMAAHEPSTQNVLANVDVPSA